MFVSVEVAEVLTKDKCRLSLSGWFHGPSLERPPHYIEAPVPRKPHLPRDVSLSRHSQTCVLIISKLRNCLNFCVKYIMSSVKSLKDQPISLTQQTDRKLGGGGVRKMPNPSSNTSKHHLHTAHNSLERRAMFKYGIDLFI